jgi:hypothetical protein
VLVQDGLFTAAQLGVGNALCYKQPQQLAGEFAVCRRPSRVTGPSGPCQSRLAARSGFEVFLVLLRFERGSQYSRTLASITFFDFANFDLPGSALNGLLTGAAGQINGTTATSHNVDRVGVGTGVYSQGAPRQIEFGLRITF